MNEATSTAGRRPVRAVAATPLARVEPLLLLHGRRFDANDAKSRAWTSDDVHHAGSGYLRLVLDEASERLSLTPVIYLVSPHLEPRMLGGRELLAGGDHLFAFGCAARRSEIKATFGPLPPRWRLSITARAGACVVSAELHPLPTHGSFE